LHKNSDNGNVTVKHRQKNESAQKHGAENEYNNSFTVYITCRVENQTAKNNKKKQYAHNKETTYFALNGNTHKPS
jgi:hypothetical protein